ncbi:hypothetical protein ACFL2X_00300 [Candidatus Latescibacterota bacterium]
MKRRYAIRAIPLTFAGIGGLALTGSAEEKSGRPEHSRDMMISPLEYQENVIRMLKWVRETQSENILESSYAIARTIRNGGKLWLNWDQGHSTNAELFPGRNGVPDFINHGYDMKTSRKGDLVMANRILSQEQYDDIAKKGIFVIGSPSPWGGDAEGAENVKNEIRQLRIRPYADIWIDTNITTVGAIIKVPGMPAPIGPVSGPLYMTIMWMVIADACRILSIEGRSHSVDGDEPKLSGENVNWVNTADPLMDNYLVEVIREMELIGAELGNLRKIASMVVDTLLDGGNVYYYSRYEYSFQTENTGRRGGFAFAKGLSDGRIEGTPKDCVIMGIYKPDDEADLRNLNEFKKRGMRVASIGPVTRDFALPGGKSIHMETETHIGRTYDTYGLYAIPGFDKKVCPTSGILTFTINWAINIEIINQIRERTGGNVPGVHFSGALEWGNDYNSRVRAMSSDRGY